MPRVSPPHGIRPGLKVRRSPPAETQAVPLPEGQLEPGLAETAKDLRVAEEDFESYEGTTYIEGSGAVTNAFADDEDSADAPAFDEAPQPEVTLGLICPLLSRRPFILNQEAVLRIGRHPEGGLCLPAPKVSRHHAEVRWDGHGFSIHDLGSTNGTFVNGRRIHRRRKLRAGMKLEIGPFSLEVREVENPEESVIIKPELGGEETRIDVSSELTGQLEEIGMGALIQFMKVTAKTGNLTLFNGHSVGQLWLEDGTVIHAEFGALYGLQAALSLLGLGAGRFEFHSADITCPRTVHKPTQYLLMEAARLVDETHEPPSS